MPRHDYPFTLEQLIRRILDDVEVLREQMVAVQAELARIDAERSASSQRRR